MAGRMLEDEHIRLDQGPLVQLDVGGGDAYSSDTTRLHVGSEAGSKREYRFLMEELR